VNTDLGQDGRAANAKLSAARGNILTKMLRQIVVRNNVSTSAIILQMNLQNLDHQICNICVLGRQKSIGRKALKLQTGEVD
jgi:hypothetical protein